MVTLALGLETPAIVGRTGTRPENRLSRAQPSAGVRRLMGVIADLRHPTRVPVLDLLLRVLAVVLTGATILGLLPALLELAA
jgi:hypothetical protein